jgi:hypothetical protein
VIHVRNGEDILPLLRGMGGGQALSWDDPVCLGPLVPPEGTPGWYDRRAAFLAEPGGDKTALRAKLAGQDRALDAALDHDEIVLWFEADLYCQSVLIRLLTRLAARPGVLARTRLMCIGDHPDVEGFIGLGQLDGDQLAELFETRAPITGAQASLAERAWTALCAPAPGPLDDFLSLDPAATEPLPFLGEAFRRFAREYPAVGDGLTLTERWVLEFLADGDAGPVDVFVATQAREPRPWRGDAMLWPVVDGLRPLLAVDGPRDWYADRVSLRSTTLGLTGAGRAVLEGAESRTPPARWLGGVELGPGRPDWRWDEVAGRVVRHLSPGSRAPPPPGDKSPGSQMAPPCGGLPRNQASPRNGGGNSQPADLSAGGGGRERHPRTPRSSEHVVEPHRRAVTRRHRALEPHRRTVTPHRRVLESHGRTVTPRRRVDEWWEHAVGWGESHRTGCRAVARGEERLHTRCAGLLPAGRRASTRCAGGYDGKCLDTPCAAIFP